ncbi:MAG: sulfopyruvate decarboxylase subunit alpha [Kribbellaceae bacterium]|jgi:sulfopyruvate decarboxylase subunit alpha|nr:sulfopyruvate decarboxylase subunit alpha [Kribbellaceae bacterium]
MPEHEWPESMLRAFSAVGVEILPYVPDGVLAPLLDQAAERGFDLVPLTREEEGVGVLSGVYLGGRRGALLMQTSGLGNSLNAIGSLAMAQRIPLPMVVTERGGLGEKVATQIPFGSASSRILAAMGVSVFEVSEASQTFDVVTGATEMAYVSRVPTVILIKSILSMEAAA